MIQLTAQHLDEIKRIAESAYPYECCGILVGSVENGVKTVSELVPAVNERTDSPANRYLITAEFIHQVERRLQGSGFTIVGFFHSHPDVPARPSAYDREHAWPWYSYLILSVRQGKTEEVHNWLLRDDRSVFDPEKMKLI